MALWQALHARAAITGVFLDFPDFSAKCLQLLIESVPTLSGIGLLWDPSTGSLQLKAVEAAAQGFGISAQVFEARRAADIAEALCARPLALPGPLTALIATDCR